MAGDIPARLNRQNGMLIAEQFRIGVSDDQRNIVTDHIHRALHLEVLSLHKFRKPTANGYFLSVVSIPYVYEHSAEARISHRRSRFNRFTYC